MNTNKLTGLTVVALAGFLIFGTAYAEEKAAPTTQSHEEHHPDAKPAEKDSGSSDMMGSGGMMGKMDMGRMHEMMGECMKMHKDGKMCDHQMMENCQKNMDKKECMKMMSAAKKQDKAPKTKK